MSLEQFLSVSETTNRELVVANRTQPEPFQRMVETLFAEQSVSVDETAHSGYPENTALLVEDGDVVAQSPLTALQDAILMVNSDLYSTGTQSLDETTVPDVIDELSDVQFTLRGYPDSNSEKLLLVLISRQIEHKAYQTGAGTLRSSFQRLSRIKDEQGTHRAYEKIAGTDVDVHVYGKPDWRVTSELDVTMHGGKTSDFTDSWFVLHQPPSGRSTSSSAMLAIETGEAKWDGFWTEEQAIIDELAAYIRAEL